MIWVIILNWNGWQDTIACLQSLSAVTSPPIRLLVVDNGSDDESVEKLREFQKRSDTPAFELLETGENKGFAGGMNAGMRHARKQGAEWLLLLNNDTVVDRDFLTYLLAAAERNERIGMANPLILHMEGKEKTDRILFFGGKIEWLRARAVHWYYGKAIHEVEAVKRAEVFDTDYATGGCVLVRREVIDEIGLMPEEYFLYYEDTEWSLRSKRAGFRCVVVPKARIWHRGAASAKEHSPSYIRYHVRNGLLFVRRNGTILQKTAVFSISALRALWQGVKLLRAATPQKRMWAKATLKGIFDAWTLRDGQISVE